MVAVPEREEEFSLGAQGVPPPPNLSKKEEIVQRGSNETWLKMQSLQTVFPVKISFSFLSETNLINMSCPPNPTHPGFPWEGTSAARGFVGSPEEQSAG